MGLDHVRNSFFPGRNVRVDDARQRCRFLFALPVVQIFFAFVVLIHGGDRPGFGATRTLALDARCARLRGRTTATAATTRTIFVIGRRFDPARFGFGLGRLFAVLIVIIERTRSDITRLGCGGRGPFRTGGTTATTATATRPFTVLVGLFGSPTGFARLVVDQVAGELVPFHGSGAALFGRGFRGPFVVHLIVGESVFLDARPELVGNRLRRPLGRATGRRPLGRRRLRGFRPRRLLPGRWFSFRTPGTFTGRWWCIIAAAGALAAGAAVPVAATVSARTTVPTATATPVAVPTGGSRLQDWIVCGTRDARPRLRRRAVGLPVPLFEGVPIRIGGSIRGRLIGRFGSLRLSFRLFRHRGHDDRRCYDRRRRSSHDGLGRGDRLRLGEFQIPLELQVDPQQIGSQLPPGIVVVLGLR